MEHGDIPKLSPTSLFFPWDSAVQKFLGLQGLGSYISPYAPPEPFRVPFKAGNEWEERAIRPDGEFAGKKPPTGRALMRGVGSETGEGELELSPEQRREWATWARNELRTRQQLLRSLNSTLIVQVQNCWSAADVYATLRDIFTSDRAHRALVWRWLRLRFSSPHHAPVVSSFPKSNGEALRAHLTDFTSILIELQAMGRPREDNQIVMQFLSSIPEEFGWPLVSALRASTGASWPVIHDTFLALVHQIEASEVESRGGKRRRGRRGQHPYNGGQKRIVSSSSTMTTASSAG